MRNMERTLRITEVPLRMPFALFCDTLSAVSEAWFINYPKEVFVETPITLDATYVPSEDVVSRDIEGELIIVPLTAGTGGTEEEQEAIFTLNETGRAIWDRLDGQRSLRDLVTEFSAEYESPAGEIERDVLGLVAELLKRNMLVEVGPAPAG